MRRNVEHIASPASGMQSGPIRIAALAAYSLAIISLACSGSGVNETRDTGDDLDGTPGTTYSNPVLNADFPDPTVIQGPDGVYYAYATETMIDAQPTNIQVASSTDLVHWTWHGDAMPAGVPWAVRGRSYWAPQVLYDPERTTYYMYFSAHNDAINGKCLAVATSSNPLGPFETDGTTLVCGDGFINIDPMAFDDPVSGKKLLYWGSGGQPIRVRELSNDRLSFKAGSAATEVVFPRQDASYSNLVEGTWVIYRDGTYFLFYSGDNCCGSAAHYAVLVARASNPLGPFERRGSTNVSNDSVILEADATWNAPGHNSIVRDADGVDWIFYHAINRAQPTRFTGIPGVYWDRRVMMMDRIQYDGGWPFVKNRHPSETAEFPSAAHPAN